MTEQAPEPVPPPRRLALYVAVPLALLLAWGAFVHWRQRSDAYDTVHERQNLEPTVTTATARLSHDSRSLTLPGQTAAFDSAYLYARATGFVAERRVDIGSRVKRGDLLLRIDAPDLDAQLNQARAQLGQMQAALVQAQATLKQAQDNKSLASINSYRATTLAREGWGTQQTADTNTTNARVSTSNVGSAQAGVGVAEANVRAQQATVDRLVALTGFERVSAPFDGVITERDVDVGDLVQSDTSSGTPLFHIDREDVLRCQVYVPQSDFAGIHDGLPAEVTVPELPGHAFHAHVSRSSLALAQNSRSMLVEIDVPNRDGLLTPGLFVNVGFTVRPPAPTVLIPDSSLIFDAKGLHVAEITPEQRVRFQPITIYRDLGTEAEVRQGLKGGETLIVNPPVDLSDDQRVHPSSAASGGAARGRS